MYLEISNPMDYHAALYIRLSKEDEKHAILVSECSKPGIPAAGVCPAASVERL